MNTNEKKDLDLKKVLSDNALFKHMTLIDLESASAQR